MKAGQQIGIAFKGYNKAFNLVFKRGYAKFFLFPLILNVLFLFGGLTFVSDLTESVQQTFSDWVNLDSAEFWGAEYLSGALSGLIWLLIRVLFFFIFAYYGGFVVMIVMSPIFSLLSEKVEKEMLGSADYPFNMKQLLRDVLRGIGISLRNLIFETFFLIVTVILSFIPVIGWLAPIVMFFISAYFFGFSFMDYTNERRGKTLKLSVTYIKKYKWVAVTNGAIFSLSLMIPYCGMLISTFVAVISVVAATVSMIMIESAEPEIVS